MTNWHPTGHGTAHQRARARTAARKRLQTNVARGNWHKRRIRENIYGNWRGYIGARCVEDFGLDEVDAHAWLWQVDALEVYKAMTRERVTRACLIKNFN